jgi:hypothetical protein
MRLQLELANGQVLELDLDITPRQWNRRFRSALRRNDVLEVENARGDVLTINPQHVVKSVMFEHEHEQEHVLQVVPIAAGVKARPGEAEPRSRRSG